jgi:hypothetical protein
MLFNLVKKEQFFSSNGNIHIVLFSKFLEQTRNGLHQLLQMVCCLHGFAAIAG